MKKIVSFVLTLVLLLSLVPVLPVAQAEATDYTNRALTTLKRETSTIAPGITQEIGTVRKQYNGQQLVYYLMKVDSTEKSAQIHVNYKDNDWQAYQNKQYGLQTVKDQMDAAQRNHSDIPNFTVVGGINGTGYNMSTGESDGYILMMEGTQLNYVNQGFYGVRKSGKAMIGWTGQEYLDAVNDEKDPLVEALGQFSGVLIKNGEIQQSDWAGSGSVPNCNARTAVGVTKEGDTFFLVVDGMQAPYSEGCDMYELALILQKAGCYNAFNWDGGGSTTYVARPEGEETYRVISKPCDGAPRAVATSLYVASTAPDDKKFARVSIDADADYITPGGTVNLTAVGITAAGTPAEIPDDVKWVVEGGSGMLSETSENNYTYVAGESTEEVTIKLIRGDDSNNVVGSATIHVVLPNTLTFDRNEYAVPYGKTIEFDIRAGYAVDDNDFEVVLKEGDVSFSLSSETLGSLSGKSYLLFL